MGCQAVFQRAGPAQLGCGTGCALNVDDIHPIRVPVFLLHPRHGLLGLGVNIGTHMGGVQAVILHIHHPVCHNHRDSRVLCLLKHGIPARFTQGHDDDVIHPQLDEPAHRHNLVLLDLPGILEEHPVAPFLREHGLHGLGVCHPPVGLRSHLGNANHNQILFLRLLRRIFGAACQRQQRQYDTQRSFHRPLTSLVVSGIRTVTVVPPPSSLAICRPYSGPNCRISR